MYDASIARWNGVDALASHPNQIHMTIYNYTWRNPIKLTDPDGNCPTCGWAAAIGLGVGLVHGLVKHGLKDGGWKKVLKSGAVGATVGFFAGAGVGLGSLPLLAGSAGATTSLGFIGGTIGAVAGEGVNQGFNVIFGDGFNQSEFEANMKLAYPSGILDLALGGIGGEVVQRLQMNVGTELFTEMTVRQQN